MHQFSAWHRLRQICTRLSSGMSSVLARRMLLWIVCISATAALIATSVQLFFDYRQDVSELDKGMHYIEQNQLPGLADAAWNFNVSSMQVQLDGIGHSPWVAGATVRYGPNQKAELTTGQLDHDADLAYRFALQRHGIVVGMIYIQPNLHTLYGRTLDRIAIVLAAQAAKSLVTSICILLLISWMITRHLTQMAEFAQSFEPGKRLPPFVLHRPHAHRDELSVLADGLNDAYARLQQAHDFEVRHNDILMQEVALRTAELQDAHERLARQAISDKLTGALNRFGLEERFATEMQRAQAEGSQLAVIMADIDLFKQVNDRWGHLVGDTLLQDFTAILQSRLRVNDTLARWGGEEFLVLCPDTSLEQAMQLAEHMRACVAAHRFAVVDNASSSFGVAAWRSGDVTDSLVKRVDDALYRAKQNGRNRVCPEAPATAG
jgi:diguanylate cyclase (GGDEF)-like protein